MSRKAKKAKPVHRPGKYVPRYAVRDPLPKMYRSTLGNPLQFAISVYADQAFYAQWGGFPDRAMRRHVLRGTREGVRDLNYVRRVHSYATWSLALEDLRFKCADCPVSTYYSSAPMCTDAVWLSVADRDERLCDRCFRRRLGRPIALHDLRICAFNMTNWKHLEGAPWSKRKDVRYRMLRWAKAKVIQGTNLLSFAAMDRMLTLLEAIAKQWGQPERGSIEIRKLEEFLGTAGQ